VRLDAEPLWSFSLYPQAGEGGGCLSVRRRLVPVSDRPPNVARAAEEAARRARGKLRRYCAANVLNRHATLTYGPPGCVDPALLRADVAAFFRELRSELGAAFPYAWVAEWHPGGHGYHVHVAFGRYVPRGAIERAWGRGFFWIKLIGDLPVGSGSRREARVVAGYLAKYVSKSFEDARRPLGRHRYEVAQGFQPEKVLVYGCSAEDVIERASGYMRSEPERVWLSSSVEGWRGPPACWAQWA
jgi:hypothetical protein